MTAAKDLLRRMEYTLRKGNALQYERPLLRCQQVKGFFFRSECGKPFWGTEEKRKEPFIPLNEGTLYGAGALQKNILALIPASKATISRALEAERNAGMSGISCYSQ